MAQVPTAASAREGRKPRALNDVMTTAMTMRVRRMSAFLRTSGSPRSAPVGRTLEPAALCGVRPSEQVSGRERDDTEHTTIEDRAGPEAGPRRPRVTGDEEAAVGAVRADVNEAEVQRAVGRLGERLHESRCRHLQRGERRS